MRGRGRYCQLAAAWCATNLGGAERSSSKFTTVSCNTFPWNAEQRPEYWRLSEIPRLMCAPLVLDRPAALTGPGGGRRRAVATAADRIATQLRYCRFRPGRDDERFKLPGSRPFARSPTLSMPAEFARRAAVNGIPPHSTTFSLASLTANPECAVRPQFPNAVMITRFMRSFDVLGHGTVRQQR